MQARMLGRCGLSVRPIGFGAFKIGRNEKTKYPGQYALPTDTEAARLLNDVLDLGIDWIDTAPAYGLSEERIGRALATRRNEFRLSTKVGETFDGGVSRYDFSPAAMETSLARSLDRLKTEAVDLLFLHVPAEDVAIVQREETIAVLQAARRRGQARALGFSAKTIEAARLSLNWADVLMVEYHQNDRSFEPLIQEAAAAGLGIVVKKGLASGHLPAAEAIRFVLGRPEVGSLTVGSLNLEHLRANIRTAEQMDRESRSA